MKSPEIQSREYRQLICTACPMGCTLEAEKEGDLIQVKGGRCQRGGKYAQDEITNPRRVMTTTCVMEGGELRRLPIRTTQPFPKNRMDDFMTFMTTVRVSAPVFCGDIIVSNVLGEGIDVIATRTIRKKQPAP